MGASINKRALIGREKGNPNSEGFPQTDIETSVCRGTGTVTSLSRSELLCAFFEMGVVGLEGMNHQNGWLFAFANRYNVFGIGTVLLEAQQADLPYYRESHVQEVTRMKKERKQNRED